jgi:DNA-binding transcriptional LysR family regulator
VAVTLTQLAAFLAVARCGSVTAAAEELVVTQPSVSAAVSALERELGVQLMERSGRHLVPTLAGRAYLPYAADVIGLLEEGRRAAHEAIAPEGRTLRVSAVTTAGEHLAPLLIQAFRKLHPEMRVSLDVGNRAAILNRLSDHTVDVAITGRVPPEARLHAEPFAENEIVLVAAPSDPLVKRRWVAPDELVHRSWLLREEGSGSRAMCEEYLATHGLKPDVLTLGSNGAIRHAARVGLGVALVPRISVDLELRHGLLAPLHVRGGLPKRSWYLARSAVGPVPDPVRQFSAFVRSDAGQRALAGD